ncbi:MAG: alanine racemase [Terrimicrobiaceae bacterium]|nr:alanine racemase [Terrimicrobiaceae bacterium]
MPSFSVSPALRSWVEVDSGALRHNLALVRKTIGPKPRILAVIKANAYGHGAAQVARTLAHDVAVFGVANLSEARVVLAAETGRQVMLLSPCLPSERKAAVEAGLIVTVSSAEEAASFAACGEAMVNFKVDTGMGRVGFAGESATEEIARMAGRVNIYSISTHLPCSDEDEPFTRSQLENFSRMAGSFRRLAPAAQIHSLNSAGILKFPEHAEDIVRAGLVLYGSSPLPEFQKNFRPALAWKTRVTLVKDLPAGAGVCYGRTFIASRPTRTAVLAVGYADGFPRQVSGKGAGVLIRGKFCPLLGRVTMDQIVVDATGAGDIGPGEEAVLIGSQGRETITAEDLAARACTISWDIYTGIQGRVARIQG